jgi:lysophospholipase L1-like esterase
MRWRTWLLVFGVNLLVLIGLAAGLEGAARFFSSPDPRPLFDDSELRRRERPFVEPHPTRGFALRPGFEDALYQIDANGFRVGPPAPANAPTWVLLGESTTFGWGVGNSDTFPAQLQAQLGARGQPVRVINAGVPSYSSTQVRRYLEEILSGDNKPDRVLINIMWNDIWYSTVLNWYPDLLVHQQPPVWLSTMLHHSALLRAILMQPMPSQAQPVDRFNADALAYYRQNLRAMLRLAAERGVPVALVEPPIAPALLPEEGLNEFHVRYTRPFFLRVAERHRAAMAEVAAEFGVTVADHRLSLSKGGGDKPYFLDLLHPTPEGNRMMAEDVATSLWPDGRAATNRARAGRVDEVETCRGRSAGNGRAGLRCTAVAASAGR